MAGDSDSKETTALERRRAFMQRPLEERRAIMRRQAKALRKHYERTTSTRQALQGDTIFSYDEEPPSR